MGNEKELSQFRALDFDADDILFSSLVRYHFEREAMEDLEKLNSDEFDAIPEEMESAQKRAKKYYHREQRLRILRHGYHVMQKVSVFLVILIAGFTYLTISVDAVNRAVVNWLTESYQTHTHLSIELKETTLKYSDISINWIPEELTLNSSNADYGIYQLEYHNQSIGTILCNNSETNTTLNTENAKTEYINLPNYDTVYLVERNDFKAITASNSKIVIIISTIANNQYNLSIGELIRILQNIDY